MEKRKKTRYLTRAELRMMNILWTLQKATVHQLHDELPEPKPAYTTTLTVMQVLTRKEFVTYSRSGRMNVYEPLVSRDDYINVYSEEGFDSVFGNDAQSVLTYFIKKYNLTKDDLIKIYDSMEE